MCLSGRGPDVGWQLLTLHPKWMRQILALKPEVPVDWSTLWPSWLLLIEGVLVTFIKHFVCVTSIFALIILDPRVDRIVIDICVVG